MSIVNRKGRKRRAPEEARREILTAAEQRLREHGLAGLNVVDVAADCGMSHATVLHHFGSTAGMRRALVGRMTDRLLEDIIAALHRDPPLAPPEVLENLFDTLSRGGHAKLLAWLTVGDDALSGGVEPAGQSRDLLARLVPELAQRLPGERSPERLARHIIFLVACTGIGYGVAGDRLPRLLGMDEAEARAFPDWLGRQIGRLTGDQ
jgi:AcrR family transcriptional regulator